MLATHPTWSALPAAGCAGLGGGGEDSKEVIRKVLTHNFLLLQLARTPVPPASSHMWNWIGVVRSGIRTWMSSNQFLHLRLCCWLPPWGLDRCCSIYCACKSAWGGTSRVTQWLRICLPMQGTRVGSLVQEDPTCRRSN